MTHVTPDRATSGGERESAAGLTIEGAAAVPGVGATRDALLADQVPVRLAGKDPTLWGPDAEAEAAVRLGWVDTATRSRGILEPLAELTDELADLDHVVLAGMGGSSLAPEVIARTLDRPLTVLDTTDPHRVRATLADRPQRTVVVVSSKSGTTVETDSQRRAYLRAFREAGLSEAEAGRRLVVVTDPGSPLETAAAETGSVSFLADPDVGGRYSALTAFGLVPAALAGADPVELIEQAEALSESLHRASDNPALSLGAALAAAGMPAEGSPRAVDVPATVAVVEDGTGIVGIGDWTEQLLAESTGKQDRGILPVVAESLRAPGATGPGVLTVSVGGALAPGNSGALAPGTGAVAQELPHTAGSLVALNGPLGALFLAWEYATAVAGRVIGINPFDQPDVAGAKDNTARILADGGLPAEEPAAVDGPVALYGTGARTVRDAVAELIDGAAPDGYVAVTAFLDQVADAAVAELRPALARATPRPVTFGWGPRYLHSTGQYHKGGPQRGSFLQVTGAVAEDVAIPGRDHTFGALQAAQAAGDRQALLHQGRPVLRLHLRDRVDGLARVRDAVRELP